MYVCNDINTVLLYWSIQCLHITDFNQYLSKFSFSLSFQASFQELLSILLSFVRGKPHIPAWLKNSIVRAIFLVGTTVFLLLARIKVMGAQLPVFTRCVIQIEHQLLSTNFYSWQLYFSDLPGTGSRQLNFLHSRRYRLSWK